MKSLIVNEVVSALPPGRKGEVCIRNSENEMSLSVTDKSVSLHE